MSDTNRTSDPAIDDVREARRHISARVDHDPARLVSYYIELQERYRDRLLRGPELPGPSAKSAA